MNPIPIKENIKHPVVPRKPLDRLLESLRFDKAKPHIPRRARLLDIGAGSALNSGVNLRRFAI